MTTFLISFMITILVGVTILGLNIAWLNQHSLDRDQELKLAKLRVCYDYKPGENDYVWRDSFCPLIEKQVLETPEYQK